MLKFIWEYRTSALFFISEKFDIISAKQFSSLNCEILNEIFEFTEISTDLEISYLYQKILEIPNNVRPQPTIPTAKVVDEVAVSTNKLVTLEDPVVVQVGDHNILWVPGYVDNLIVGNVELFTENYQIKL